MIESDPSWHTEDMQRTRPIGLLALAWVCACSNGGEAEAGDDEAGDLDEGFSGPLPACLAETNVHCQASPSDRPPPTCEADCSLVADLRLDCSGFDYSPDPRLAVIGEDTYMVMRSPQGAGLFRTQGNTWTAITELPCGFDRGTDDVLAARGPDGALYLLTDTHPPMASEGGATLARLEANQWTSEAVFHAEEPAPVEALVFAPDGSAHAWFATSGEVVHSTRPAGGTWTHAIELEDAKRWSLSPAGEPIRLVRTEQDALLRLSAGPIGTEWEFGELDYDSTMRLIDPAPESALAQPEIVALVHRSDALRIHWVDHDGEASFEIPNTQHLQFPCDEDCGDGCHDGARGIQSQGYAGVRAADGRLWIAWVDTQHDTDHIDFNCEPIGDDESTSTLRLARFDFATLALEPILEASILLDDGSNVDMHVDGGRLSLVWENQEDYSLRLIQLDVSG